MTSLEQQKLSHNRIKLILAIFGVFITLFGIGVERWATYEQRQFEAQNKILTQRITRMNEIGSEFDNLVEKTIQFSVQRDIDEVFLKSAIETAVERMQKQKTKTEGQKELIVMLTNISERLNEESEIGEWRRAIELQAEWEVKQSGFTPDIGIYFGPEIMKNSIEVAEAAWGMINRSMHGEGSHDYNEFKELSNKLSTLVRHKISDEVLSNKP